jgi:hypothetical protein
MAANSRWTELLTCPDCGQSGVVHLSQPEGRPFDVNIETIPLGFKIADHRLVETFFCRDCDRPAKTALPAPRQAFLRS